jgi:hypothetical protein
VGSQNKKEKMLKCLRWQNVADCTKICRFNSTKFASKKKVKK